MRTMDRGAALLLVPLILALAVADPADAYETDGLLLYLDATDPASFAGTGDPSDGDQWTDLGPEGRDGTFRGSLTYDTIDRAIVFPGGKNGSHYVDLDGDFDDFSGGVSVEFEIEFAQDVQSWARVFDFAAGVDSTADAFWVGRFSDRGEVAVEVFVGGARKGYCYTATDDTALNGVDEGGTSGWSEGYTRWLLTIGSDRMCRWYRNGTAVATRVTTDASSFDTSPTGADTDGSLLEALPAVTTRTSAFLGRSNFTADQDLNGSIRYIRMYDRDLDATEVEGNASRTVTFAANGGSGTMTAQSAVTAAALRANTYTRPGYSFAGWSTSADGSGTDYGDGATFPFAANATLYAQWTLVPPPALTCTPDPVTVGAPVTCQVSGGDPDIDILWRASAAATTTASAGVTLDGTGRATFTFPAPAAALGERVTVDLVEWDASDTVDVTGPTPTSVPSGDGPSQAPLSASLPWLALATGALLVDRSRRRGRVSG